jgi:hypothetical protein
MKKILLSLSGLILSLPFIYAQPKEIFIRHDSVLLKSGECNWLIPPNLKADPSLYRGSESNIAEWLLASIHKGKIRAMDPQTRQQIPAKEIYTWQMPTDTMLTYDLNMEPSGHKVVRRERQARDLKQLRVIMDWYMDGNGKIFNRLRAVDLMEEIRTYDGSFLGYRTLCRINY